MRQWTVDHSPARLGNVLADAIELIGNPGFEKKLLERVHTVLPAASCSVYQTGPACVPTLFMSASHGVPDTTVDCWRAYLSGPQRVDRSLVCEAAAGPSVAVLNHITAGEVPAEHRAKVYEAHGVAERVSIVEVRQDGVIFAINFYRHQHQRAFRDAQIAAMDGMATSLLALTRKHLALLPSDRPLGGPPLAQDQQLAFFERQLRQVCAALTPRERQVCAALLLGLTTDGVACSLGLSAPTVKTYRNRAFDKLGIRFRNQLFALVLRGAPPLAPPRLQ
jgi:DNA-binding CsgD family transcriptional regulator